MIEKQKLVKRASVMALATVVGCGIFGCQKKTEPIIPEVSVRVEETLDNDGDIIKEVEVVDKFKDKTEETETQKETLDKKSDDYLMDLLRNNPNVEVYDSEEELIDSIIEELNSKPGNAKDRDEFWEKNGVIDLPESEWGTIYNVDDSDPRICPGSGIRAYSSLNPLGKDGYELRYGLIVPKLDVIDQYTAPSWIGTEKSRIEYQVFLKNNPGITLRDNNSGWGSFDRWTYVELEYPFDCVPRWDEKRIPIKTKNDLAKASQDELFVVADGPWGYPLVMDTQLTLDRGFGQIKDIEFTQPSKILDKTDSVHTDCEINNPNKMKVHKADENYGLK